MTRPVVFIAAEKHHFDIAVAAEKFAREAGTEVLNPTVSLPCHLARCCYLPIELAMLEASDILWLISSCEHAKIRSLVHYALAQNITIVTSEQELVQEMNKYKDNEQLIMEEINE